MPENQPTPEEIQRVQGTRLSEKSPWETYADEMNEILPEDLEAAVQEYASRDPHSHTDSQTEEELCRQKEAADAQAKDYQFLDPKDYEEEDARMGEIMHSSQLIRKLQNCGLRCWYAAHPQPGRVKLMVDTSNGTKDPEIGCWVQEGWTTEYSICNFDSHDVLLQEAYRGWRTVLLQLIVKKMLTEEVATKVFGKATGPASERYNSILYGLRNQA
jgi:hypothetical protein